MSNYYGTVEYQIDLMLNRESDMEKEREQVIQRMRDGVDGDMLLPEGDPYKVEDYVRDPHPTSPCDTCEHGFYWTDGVQSGVWYHLNGDLGLWEICDEDVDVEQWAREGKPVTQPIDDSTPNTIGRR